MDSKQESRTDQHQTSAANSVANVGNNNQTHGLHRTSSEVKAKLKASTGRSPRTATSSQDKGTSHKRVTTCTTQVGHGLQRSNADRMAKLEAKLGRGGPAVTVVSHSADASISINSGNTTITSTCKDAVVKRGLRQTRSPAPQVVQATSPEEGANHRGLGKNRPPTSRATAQSEDQSALPPYQGLTADIEQPLPSQPLATSKTHVSNKDLVEAMPIPDESSKNMLQVAEQVDPDWLEQKSLNNHKTSSSWKLATCFLLIAGCAIVAIVSVVKISRKDAVEEVFTVSPTDNVSMDPSTLAPSTLAPTTSLDLLLMHLPISTQERIDAFGTPQWQAWQWLLQHPNITKLAEWRKQQLFALVTFYYAFQGPNWPHHLGKDWLDYGKDECQEWWSGEFGYKCDWMGQEEESYIEEGTFGVDPCNGKGGFQLLYLSCLNLGALEPSIPPEIALLPSLSILDLSYNGLNASWTDAIPTELFQLSNLTKLYLTNDHLLGSLPTQLGLMTNLEEISFWNNKLTNPLPSELGLLTNLRGMDLNENRFNGSIPTTIGALTKLDWISLYINGLTGPLPSELGLATNLAWLVLHQNSLSGPLPSQLGRMTKLTALGVNENELISVIPTEVGLLSSLDWLELHSNDLTGPIPSQFSSIPTLTWLSLHYNRLTGHVPAEFDQLVFNGSLSSLQLQNNSLMGTFSETLCMLGNFDWNYAIGLSFDCTAQLCGCCWCPCGTSNSSAELDCQSHPFVPSRYDEDWPGSFPTPVGMSNSLTINIHSDEFPEETTFEWSQYTASRIWESLYSGILQNASSLHSFQQEVASNTLYKLQVVDNYGDGTCCEGGLGWFTITNSTPSHDYQDGTVVWRATGHSFESSMEVFIWIDSAGHSLHVIYVPGHGYALSQDETAAGDEQVVVPEPTSYNTSGSFRNAPNVP